MNIIGIEEVKKRIANGEKLHLLDVREPHERDDFHIGGIHLPLGKVQSMQLEDIEDWKDEEIIVYCRSGQRSMMAAQMLLAAGFSNVANLQGGMLAWKQ